jgi:hypothetical protein
MMTTRVIHILRAVAVFAVIAAAIWFLNQWRHSTNTTTTLHDLSSVDVLRAQFNQDAGKTRLILLLSPT